MQISHIRVTPFHLILNKKKTIENFFFKKKLIFLNALKETYFINN